MALGVCHSAELLSDHKDTFTDSRNPNFQAENLPASTVRIMHRVVLRRRLALCPHNASTHTGEREATHRIVLIIV